MQIDLSRVRGEPLHWRETRVVPAAELERSELADLSPVECHGQVSWIDPGFLFTARLEYEQTLVCTRCLTTFAEPVSAGVELLLLVDDATERHRNERTAPEHGEPEEQELSEDDLGVVTLEEERFDTEPFLREQLQLNLPMKPLCRPECRGLCPGCGADLERGKCSCTERPADPRWEALADLRGRLSKDEE